MNYLQQILAFNDYLLYEQELSSGQIALWHALMSINNKTAWANWFTAANQTLESLSGLSRSGILKARNILKQQNLIDFTPNGRNKATSYHMCVLYMSDSKQQRNATGYSKGTQQEHNSTPLNKLNKTETKEKKMVEASRQSVFDLWQSLWGFPNAIARQDIEEWLDAYSTDLMIFAINIAGRRNVAAKGADNYLKRVFEDWHNRGIDTVEKANQAAEAHRQQVSNEMGGRISDQSKKVESLPDWAKDDYKPKKDASQALSAAEMAELDRQLADMEARNKAKEKG